MKTLGIREEFKGLTALAAFAVLLVLVLSLLNWIPSAVQRGTLAKYSDVGALKAGLGLKRVMVPSYFPQNITWPPSVVLGQSVPFESVVLEFKGPATDGPALTVSQARREGFRPEGRIRIASVMQSVPYELDGRRAILSSGQCARGGRCSVLSWTEADGLAVEIRLRGGPLEAVKIAHSLVATGG